jgi:4-amino-4-deoxy-L-arabinose transferase-like glycosyltransferase
LVFFFLVTIGHWVALPTLITWDGHEYLALSEVLGSDRFPREWSWLRTPLFPLGLKLSFALLGRNPLAATGVPLLMAVMGCLIVASSVRRIAGDGAAALSLVLLAAYPTLVAFEHAILTETGTFFFVALALRLSLAVPETRRAVWGKVLALGLVLAAGYYWRQSILALAPWFALLHVLAERGRRKGRRGFLELALQASVLLLLPWLLKTPWSIRFDTGDRNARVLQAFAVKQVLVPIDDPQVANVSGDYAAAVESFEKTGAWSGMPWSEASRIAARLDRPSSSGAFAYLAPLAVRHPARYAAGVSRTLLLFTGFDDRGESSIPIFRALVLSPSSSGAQIGEGPEPAASRFRRELDHRTTTGLLQRLLWSLRGVFDSGLIVCNVATMALLLISVRSRDSRLLAVSGTPVVFALAHALFLLSIDRFMVPIYPITIACGILAAAALFAARPFRKWETTMPEPTRASRVRTAALAVAGTIAFLALAHACGKPQRTGTVDRPAPPPAEAGAPGAAGPQYDAAKVLPHLACGRLDGAKPAEDGSVFLWGWAYDPRNGAPAKGVILLDNGRQVSPLIPLSRERPDVATATGNPSLRTTGWNFQLPPGPRRGHAFEAFAVLEDGKLGILGGNLQLPESGEPGATSP